MEQLRLLGIKDIVTHSTAQIRLYDGDIYDYLNAVTTYLLQEGIDIEVVQDIFIHAWNYSLEEVNTIKAMKERYGIDIHVGGHGGSQIHPRIALEKYFI